MFDWPFKSEDIDDIITNLEKKIVEKDLEITQQSQQIKELITSLEEYRNKFRIVNAKVEYVEEEFKKLKNASEKSKLKLTFLGKEIGELRNKLVSKQHRLSSLNLENKHLKEKIKQIESQLIMLSISSFNNLLKTIKEVLSHKGFLSKKEFEDQIKSIDFKLE